jgi:hypothetical protein
MSEPREDNPLFDGTSNLELEIRIDTCARKYAENHKNKPPTIIILSDPARKDLLERRLLTEPLNLESIKSRDVLTTENTELQVYNLSELSVWERMKAQVYLQQNPEAIYIGQSTFWKREIKEKSLESYNLAESSSSLSQA